MTFDVKHKNPPQASFRLRRCGMPDRIRTCDLRSRSPTRYPAAPRAHMFDLRRSAWVCFLLFGGQTVVKGVSLFYFRCALCQCLQPLAGFRYSTRRVCRSPTRYPAAPRARMFDLRRSAWVCFFAFGGQTVVKDVSLFCFRCPRCQCLQPLADF